MVASYPSAFKTFNSKANITDIIDASHPNSLQEEVVAIETTLGLSPATSTSPSPSGTFVSTSTAFTNVSARLANIEIGIVGDTHTQYVKKTDGTVSSASTSAGVVRNIYTSTSSPSGGNDGDVWFKYV